MRFHDVAIVPVGGNDYRIHFLCMAKNEVVYRMKNADLSEKSGHLR